MSVFRKKKHAQRRNKLQHFNVGNASIRKLTDDSFQLLNHTSEAWTNEWWWLRLTLKGLKSPFKFARQQMCDSSAGKHLTCGVFRVGYPAWGYTTTNTNPLTSEPRFHREKTFHLQWPTAQLNHHAFLKARFREISSIQCSSFSSKWNQSTKTYLVFEHNVPKQSTPKGSKKKKKKCYHAISTWNIRKSKIRNDENYETTKHLNMKTRECWKLKNTRH